MLAQTMPPARAPATRRSETRFRLAGALFLFFHMPAKPKNEDRKQILVSLHPAVLRVIDSIKVSKKIPRGVVIDEAFWPAVPASEKILNGGK